VLPGLEGEVADEESGWVADRINARSRHGVGGLPWQDHWMSLSLWLTICLSDTDTVHGLNDGHFFITAARGVNKRLFSGSPFRRRRLACQRRMKARFNSIESVIADVRKGRMVIVVDDADRESEGDLIMAAQHVTPAAVNFMAKHGRGLICAPSTGGRSQQPGCGRT